MIRFEQLVVRYGALAAVDGLDLRVPAGSLFGLLGPNGAGKTTALACVAGLRVPTAGAVFVDGVDVRARPAEARRRVGLVPQRLALYPTLTVAQNLRFFGGVHGLAGARLRDRVAWGLALAQLDERADARVETLSGGMARRLNLACALLHDPPLVLCDEPTTGVDPQSRNHLFDTLRALHAEGRTLVYTTHYMEEVQALCDEVAIVDRGRLVVHDRLDALLRSTASARFRIEVARGDGASAGEADVRAALGAAGLRLDAVTPAERTLEEVFLDLTGRALRDEA